MPARAKLDRSIYLRTGIPESVYVRMVAHLWSPLEGRVPKGAYQEFLTQLIRNFFAELDAQAKQEKEANGNSTES